MDVQGLRNSFARAAMHGDAVPLFFYSDLFLRHPETRDLFPVSMVTTRDRLVYALAKIVSQVDNLGELKGFLRGLGRDHRKFGAIAGHFPAVGTSLRARSRAAPVRRDDQTMDFHVRMIDGGTLSMVLTRGLAVGARLRIGSPFGVLSYDLASRMWRG